MFPFDPFGTAAFDGSHIPIVVATADPPIAVSGGTPQAQDPVIVITGG